MACFLMSTAHGLAFLDRMNCTYTYPLHLKAVKGVKFGSKEERISKKTEFNISLQVQYLSRGICR